MHEAIVVGTNYIILWICLNPFRKHVQKLAAMLQQSKHRIF